jgi:hypothetical protein
MAMAPPRPRSKDGKIPPSNDSPLYVPPKPLPADWLEWVKEWERRQDRNTNPLLMRRNPTKEGSHFPTEVSHPS